MNQLERRKHALESVESRHIDVTARDKKLKKHMTQNLVAEALI